MTTPRGALVLVLGVFGLAGAARGSITDGTVTDGHPGVVALLANERVHCSGILVGRRIVLTAAHCLSDGRPDTVLLESSPGERRYSRVQRAWRHPAYTLGRADFDVGVILLAAPGYPPLTTAKLASVTTRDIGSEFRIAGYGRVAPGDIGPVDKREGTMSLAAVAPHTLTFRAAPSLACGGDSGGPVMRQTGQATTVVGVISNGDAGCALRTEATRTDVHARAFIEPLMTRIEARSGAAGTACIEDANCASGRCIAPEGAPDFGYCTASCSDDSQCPAPMRCAAPGSPQRTCVLPQPSPGAVGAPCSLDSECQFGVCSSVLGGPQKACSALCFPDDPASCPGTSACTKVAGSSDVWRCVRPPRSNRIELSSHGCAAAPFSASRLGDPLCVAILVVLVIGVRRRRSR